MYIDSQEEADNLEIDTRRCDNIINSTINFHDEYFDEVRKCALSKLENSKETEDLEELLQETEVLKNDADKCTKSNFWLNALCLNNVSIISFDLNFFINKNSFNC